MSKTTSPAIGSLFMVGIPESTVDNSTINLVKEFRIHNFILFRRNVEGPLQLKRLCTSLNDLCRENSLPKPLISIDQEGGSVSRLAAPFSQFQDQRQIAESSNCLAALRDYATICATELKDIGINMNLAPVLDICPKGQGFFMEKRCLGNDPETVSQYGTLVIEEIQRHGVAACAKHFPGLGKSLPDPHLELPTVIASRQEMELNDFLPFQAAAVADVAAFMTSHTLYPNLDPNHPATLSKLILHDILRDQLDYQGLVITDDLEMGAIEENGAIADAALASFIAGADLLLICHSHQKIKLALAALKQAYQEKQITRSAIEIAISRQAKVRDRFA